MSSLEFSTGNEPWIFRAAEPNELVGRHRRLMRDALQRGEQIGYMLYSPMWHGGGHHFGIRGTPASHALAITAGRFVITRDPHRGDDDATTMSILIRDVLMIEKGSALLLSWFVIRYVEDGRLVDVTILHKGVGTHHFDNVIAWYRTHADPVRWEGGSPSPDGWKSVPRFLFYEMEPVLVAGEVPFLGLHSSEQWGETRRLWARRRVFRKPWAAFFLSPYGVVAGVVEAPQSREMTFGANVLLAAPGAVARMSVDFAPAHGGPVPVIRTFVSRGAVLHSFDIPFDEPIEEVAGVLETISHGNVNPT